LNEWREVKTQRDSATIAVLEIIGTIDNVARDLRRCVGLRPGEQVTIMDRDYSSLWPAPDRLRRVLQELRDAHLTELNAFNRLNPEEQTLASVER
jgi:hypothetical protein